MPLAAVSLGALLILASADQSAAQLAGDCDGDGSVTIAELVTLVAIALGHSPVTACAAGDTNGDGSISISELIAAVANALCGGPCPTPPSVCGNGILELGEQCDPPSDAACPGACDMAVPPSWDCVVCGAVAAPCSGASELVAMNIVEHLD